MFVSLVFYSPKRTNKFVCNAIFTPPKALCLYISHAILRWCVSIEKMKRYVTSKKIVPFGQI